MNAPLLFRALSSAWRRDCESRRLLPLREFLRIGLVASALWPSTFVAAEPVPTGTPGAEAPLVGEMAAYAGFGSAVADQMRMADLKWSEAQFNAFVAGIRASYRGRSYRFDAAAQRLSEQVAQRIQDLSARSAEATPTPAAVEQYMREAREGLNMQRSDSGLLYLIVQGGAGPRPQPGDRIIISFTVVAADGKTPLPQLEVKNLRTKVSDLLPGLAEGVQLIALGGHAAFVLPPQLSFGSGQWPAGVDVGTPLLFRVELVDILPANGTP